jgi:hypothetical protein
MFLVFLKQHFTFNYKKLWPASWKVGKTTDSWGEKSRVDRKGSLFSLVRNLLEDFVD